MTLPAHSSPNQPAATVSPHPLARRVDWDSVTAEAVATLSRYIRVDTSHPAGQTADAAALLQELLAAEGIETRLYETPVAGKVNLVAHLRSDAPVGKPFVLSNHMDVVQAIAADWTFDPYSGEVANGHVYGRGALDMKGMGVMELMAFVQLKRLRVPLVRDVVLLCTCDEEIGSTLGAHWLVDNYFADLDPAFVLDEGGHGVRGVFSAGDVFEISVGEKRILWLTMVARAEPGHASQPWPEAATHRLVRAAHAILAQPPEDRECPPVAELIQRLGPAAKREIMAQRATAPMLHDTISLTMLSGGYKVNIIPERAEMTFDCRLLPDTDDRAFLSNLEQIVNDPGVTFQVARSPDPPATSPWVDAPLFAALDQACRAYAPRAPVTPTICVGGTDARYFRARGVPAYGLVPGLFTAEDLKGFHGVDERLSIANLRLGTQVVFDVAARVAAAG